MRLRNALRTDLTLLFIFLSLIWGIFHFSLWMFWFLRKERQFETQINLLIIRPALKNNNLNYLFIKFEFFVILQIIFLYLWLEPNAGRIQSRINRIILDIHSQYWPLQHLFVVLQSICKWYFKVPSSIRSGFQVNHKTLYFKRFVF